MGIETWNRNRVPVGSDNWNLIADLLAMARANNHIIPVHPLAERNALAGLTPDGVLPPGTTVTRIDLGGVQEVWDGIAWNDPATGAPRTMWRRIQGNGNTQLVQANTWTNIVNWVHTPGTPEPSESGIPYSSGAITIPKTGRWAMDISVAIEPTAEIGSGRMSVLLRPSVTDPVEAGTAAAPYASASISTIMYLTAGETVAAQFRHTSGTAKNIHNNPSLQWWNFAYVGPR